MVESPYLQMRINRACNDREISVLELSKLAGIPYRQLVSIVSGRPALVRYRQKLAAYFDQVDARKMPTGTPVTVTRDDGTTLETVTRSEPWDLHGKWVVMVKGISGCYSLERVAPRTAVTA